MVNDLQKCSITGKLFLETLDLSESFSQILMKKLYSKENVLELRKFVIDSESEFDSDYQKLYKSLFDSIYGSNIGEIKKKTLLLELGEYTYRDNFVADHEINFFCFILSAETIIKA
jgi:hypothetical protein